LLTRLGLLKFKGHMTDFKELMVRLDKVENQSFFYGSGSGSGFFSLIIRQNRALRAPPPPSLFAIYCVNFLPARYSKW
jgi:hypothetical protein